VIFASESKDSETRGLTKGPTGLSDIVLEPLKGLDNAIITDLARSVAKKALEPLQLTSRPEYLEQPSPVILSSAHDCQTGTISLNGKLTVVAFGSPGKTGIFSIGNVALDIPMTERKPGHYVGEFVPLSSDSFQQQFVVVSLKDSVGRVSLQRLAKTPVSFR
jgi:hypothetical protein